MAPATVMREPAASTRVGLVAIRSAWSNVSTSRPSARPMSSAPRRQCMVFSNYVVMALALNKETLLTHQAKHHGIPVYAANLSASDHVLPVVPETQTHLAVDVLERTAGEIINGWLPDARTPNVGCSSYSTPLLLGTMAWQDGALPTITAAGSSRINIAPRNGRGSLKVHGIRCDIHRNFMVENASRGELIQLELRKFVGETYGERITIDFELYGLVSGDIHVLGFGVDLDRTHRAR